jgi:hypothetical protein
MERGRRNCKKTITHLHPRPCTDVIRFKWTCEDSYRACNEHTRTNVTVGLAKSYTLFSIRCCYCNISAAALSAPDEFRYVSSRWLKPDGNGARARGRNSRRVLHAAFSRPGSAAAGGGGCVRPQECCVRFTKDKDKTESRPQSYGLPTFNGNSAYNQNRRWRTRRPWRH